jgi:hypothetical protein
MTSFWRTLEQKKEDMSWVIRHGSEEALIHTVLLDWLRETFCSLDTMQPGLKAQ